MPDAFLLTLRRLNDVPLPIHAGDVVHAAFYELLARGDAALAERLHAANARKPFTACLLPPDEDDAQHPTPNTQYLTPASPSIGNPDCALRITLLDEGLFPQFARGLLHKARPAPLRLGGARYALDDVLATSALHPQANSASFAQLWTQTPPADTLRLRFVTPTAFRSHDRDILWPDTRLLWQSWARAWNAHATADVPQIAEDALLSSAERIRIGPYHLQTRAVRFKGVAQTGFTGECAFSLADLSAEERHIASVLAEFAFYAGTGRKTGIGMGQTRVRGQDSGVRKELPDT